MKTSSPNLEATEMCMLETEKMSCSIEVPLQQMFDEFMVFISKTDFE